MLFSPDGKTLASGDYDNKVILWNVATHLPIGQPLIGYSVAFGPDGKTLATGSENDVILWDIASHQPIGQPLRGHVGSVVNVAFSPDGKTLASKSKAGASILWDVSTLVNTGMSIYYPMGQTLFGHGDFIWSVAFSRDGKILASESADGTIILWDVESHQPIGQAFTGFDKFDEVNLKYSFQPRW